MRQLYLDALPDQISQTVSGKLAGLQKSQIPSGESTGGKKRATPSLELPAKICPTSSGKSTEPLFNLADLARAFPLPWSHYVLLISRSRSPEAFAFYHTEALRGGWSVHRQPRGTDDFATETISGVFLVKTLSI